MEYELKGDYFDNQYHTVPETSTTGAHERLQKPSPANTNHTLWELAVYYDHIDAVVQSPSRGLSYGEISLLESAQNTSTDTARPSLLKKRRLLEPSP